MSSTVTADLLDALVDADSWRSWDLPAVDHHLPTEYRSQLAAAAEKSGNDESIATGSALVAGEQVGIIAGDFNFLAGSIGRESADRILNAFERATSLGLPILALPVSGGTRMQEGTPTFLLMAALAGAVKRHRDAGLPYLVYLRHPTTGGVFASWGSLGDITYAEPGALIGFLGPRVYEGLHGKPFPEGIQTAAGLTAAGVIDGELTISQWRDEVSKTLLIWRSRAEEKTPEWAKADTTGPMPAFSVPGPTGKGPTWTGWECVERTRQGDRPGVRELLAEATDLVPLSGTHRGETAQATLLCLARLGGVGCVLVGQDRTAEQQGQSVGPSDLRLAQRAMRLAQRWHLPLVTVIDTQGGELSQRAEEGALAGEIARCLSDLSDLRVPTVAVMLGGGAGGAALALLACDRVVAVADSWISPLPPEGGSLITHRDVAHAAAVADSQSIRATDLLGVGAVDRIVASPLTLFQEGNPLPMQRVIDAVVDQMSELAFQSVDLGARAGKWLNIGIAN